MLDTEWLNDPHEASHVLAWAREFARKKNAAGQQVWFAGIEDGYRRVRAAWAAAFLAERLYDDGLAEVCLQQDQVAVSYNGGSWQCWQVLNLAEDWQERLNHVLDSVSATLCLLPEAARDFLMRQEDAYVKGHPSDDTHHWGMVLFPGAEYAARLTVTEPHHDDLPDQRAAD